MNWRIAALAAHWGMLFWGCNSHESPPPRELHKSGLLTFTEVGPQVFPRVVHHPGPLDDFPLPQIMGSGAGLFDYDTDGDLDVLLIPGATADHSTKPGGMLWRQEADGSFVDVTGESGLVPTGFGMGAAVGDLDNDGDLDLYLTNYGYDQLWENLGDGSFREIGSEAGIVNPSWGTAACFCDLDRDGWLDLFVVNYVDYFPDTICDDGSGKRDYCGPSSFSPTCDKLYRNLGKVANGSPRFQDVTVESGIATGLGRGLGVLCRDFSHDGRPDLYVANDMEPNRLWVQQDDGRFRDEAIERGVAVNINGTPEASMGVAAGDISGDGLEDYLITHLRSQTHTLYEQVSPGFFHDGTAAAGLAAPSVVMTGFGVALADLEHDGDLDLALANGRVRRAPPVVIGSPDEYWDDYAEPNQLFLNDGLGRFRELEGDSCPFTLDSEVSRGLATGDIDNDGDTDVLISNCGGPARLFRNDFEKQGHWLTVRVIDPDLQRDAIGARIIVSAGDAQFVRVCDPSSSYLSINDLRAHFGLGNAARYESIVVEWPSGSPEREEFPGGTTDRHIILEHGAGVAP